MRLAGIKPGMVVADFMAANGYYSELLSYVVGPKGHVYLLNNIAYDNWGQNGWKKRIDGRLPNVEHLQMDAEHLGLADKSRRCDRLDQGLPRPVLERPGPEGPVAEL